MLKKDILRTVIMTSDALVHCMRDHSKILFFYYLHAYTVPTSCINKYVP